MNYTSVEQSKKLLELGLSPRTADMFYLEEWVKQGQPIYKEIPEAKKSNYPDDDMPCWSIGALMDVMPILIDINRVWLTPYNGGYSCTYGSYKGTFHAETSKFAIDACYDMVIWLLENGYIKN